MNENKFAQSMKQVLTCYVFVFFQILVKLLKVWPLLVVRPFWHVTQQLQEEVTHPSLSSGTRMGEVIQFTGMSN